MTDTLNLKHGITVQIEQDEFTENPLDPKNNDPVGSITYRKGSRETLGTEAVDNERFEAIKALIETGQVIGMPVYAYVHGSATVKAAESNPFSCPWDSGQSGFVYCTREKACEEWGTKADHLAAALAKASGIEWTLSDEAKQKALNYMAGEVEEFACYLRGEVYVITVRDKDGAVLDSCCGFVGTEYAEEEATRMGHEAERNHERRQRAERTKARREATERTFWAARGVVTA